MENTLKNITALEEKITMSINLLEIAKGYCEYNFDKGEEVIALHSIIDIVLEIQQKLANELELAN